MSTRRPPWRPPPALAALLPPDAAPDPDAPLITWRWHPQRHVSGARAERTVTTHADLIAPASVDRAPHHYVRVGESYLRTFALLGIPRRLVPTTLGRIMCLPGVHTVVVNNPVPRQRAKERLQRAAKDMHLVLHQIGEAEAADESLAEQDLRRHLTALVSEQSGHHLVAVYFTVHASDMALLTERAQAVVDACATSGFALTRCDWQHWEGVLTTAPFGYDQLRYFIETDSPTLARLLPTSPPARQSTGGQSIVYGFRAQPQSTIPGEPIIYDRFAALSPHQAKIAATRGGKTYQECMELAQRFAYGNCAIVVLDPKAQEYKGFIEQVLGGTYLVFGHEHQMRLNPLMLPVGSAATIAALQKLGTDVPASRAAVIKQIIADEARVRGRALSGQAEAQFEEAVLACYGQRGITHDPATFHADVPTLGDVVAYLHTHAADPTLIEACGLFTEGALGRMINGPSTLSLDVPASRKRSDVGVLGIDLSPMVLSNDATLQRVMPVLIANYCLTIGMLHAAQRPTELVIDEAWVLLQTAAGAKLLESGARMGAALKLALTVITQQVREFLYRPHDAGEVPNASGRAFLANCETVLLLPQLRAPRTGMAGADDPTMQAAEHFGLRPGEVAWLATCQRLPDGRGSMGLLLRGREPIPLIIPRAPGALHQWIESSAASTAAEVAHA